MRFAGATLTALALAATQMLIAGCGAIARTPPADPPASFVDNTHAGMGLDRFYYLGKWETVHGRHDGRLGGTSTRSYHIGDSLGFSFIGTGFRLYGVTGPNGGHGILGIDGTARRATLDFYSPVKRTQVLIYQSTELPRKLHAIAIAVDEERDKDSRGTFVNLDGIQITH